MEIQLQSDASEGQLNLIFDMLYQVRNVPGDIVEVGSWKCGTSAAIAATYPSRNVYAFDIFGGFPYGEERGFEWLTNNNWEEVKQLADQFPNLIPVRGRHEETIPEFAKQVRMLSLIFMDSDHYESHKVSLTHLCPLLSSGGIIIFHDLFEEVKAAIEQCIPENHYEMLGERDLHKMVVLRKK